MNNSQSLYTVGSAVLLVEPACAPGRKRNRTTSPDMTDINVSTKVRSESRTTTKSVKATSNRGKGKRKGDKKQIRLLNVQERSQVLEIDREMILVHIHTSLASTLVSALFPERLTLWESIRDTTELKRFIYSAIDKYISLYEHNSKGKEKYATLYLAWLDYICTFTCRSRQTLATLASLALLRGYLVQDVSFNTQRTVIAGILHSVQEAIQSQMATKIETVGLQADSSTTDLCADDTALYRLSGWALKSCVDNTKKLLKKESCAQAQQQLEILLALKRPNASKVSLPAGAQYLDRGGLTFMHSCLLPWLNKVEASIKVFLNHNGFTKYGKDIFQVRPFAFELVHYIYTCKL